MIDKPFSFFVSCKSRHWEKNIAMTDKISAFLSTLQSYSKKQDSSSAKHSSSSYPSSMSDLSDSSDPGYPKKQRTDEPDLGTQASGTTSQPTAPSAGQPAGQSSGRPPNAPPAPGALPPEQKRPKRADEDKKRQDNNIKSIDAMFKDGQFKKEDNIGWTFLWRFLLDLAGIMDPEWPGRAIESWWRGSSDTREFLRRFGSNVSSVEYHLGEVVSGPTAHAIQAALKRVRRLPEGSEVGGEPLPDLMHNPDLRSRFMSIVIDEMDGYLAVKTMRYIVASVRVERKERATNAIRELAKLAPMYEDDTGFHQEYEPGRLLRWIYRA
jgi:hypothetical protein